MGARTAAREAVECGARRKGASNQRGLGSHRPGPLFSLPFIHVAGTGFIIDPEGLVVTNYHVVQDADEINVTMDDGTRHPARRGRW